MHIPGITLIYVKSHFSEMRSVLTYPEHKAWLQDGGKHNTPTQDLQQRPLCPVAHRHFVCDLLLASFYSVRGLVFALSHWHALAAESK